MKIILVRLRKRGKNPEKFAFGVAYSGENVVSDPS
jgi:hypothetical protein